MANILSNKKIKLKGESHALLKYPYNLTIILADGKISGTYGAFDDRTCKISGKYGKSGEVYVETKSIFPFVPNYIITGSINKNGDLEFQAKVKNPFFSNYDISGYITDASIVIDILPRGIFARRHYIIGRMNGEKLKLDDFDGLLLDRTRTPSLDYVITGDVRELQKL
jgi:hypothetical protein